MIVLPANKDRSTKQQGPLHPLVSTEACGNGLGSSWSPPSSDICTNFKKMPLTLYEVETVKVSIEDQNYQADSYPEVKITKLYIAINKDYYIQLRIQELRMCKWIRYTHYCEELFLIKHKTKHSCESAIFCKLDKDTIKRNCHFRCFYNTTVIPSILYGGTHIVLAHMVNNKKLVCSDSFNLDRPLPSYCYVVVSRKILCNCRLEAELTYLLRSLRSCSNANKDLTLYFTINIALYHYMNSYINNNNTIVLNTSTLTPQGFAIVLQLITNVNGQPIIEQPDNFKGNKSLLQYEI